MGGLSGADVGMLGAAGAVVLFAVVYAWLHGDRRDPLERLAAWARTHEFEYVAAESDDLLAAFVGERDGQRIEVKVARVGRGFGNDLPTRTTTVTVGSAGGAPASAGGSGPVGAAGPVRAAGPVSEPASAGTPVVAPVCVVQPAGWAMDRDGREAGEPMPSGDADFDAKWSARGPDAAAVRQCLSPGVRARLLGADADGLIVELSQTTVAIPMPGVGADARELDRRLTVAVDLHAAQMA